MQWGLRAMDAMDVDRQDLQRTIETLAAMDRGPCTPGEREAAEWLLERLRQEGCETRLETDPAFTGFARTHAALSVTGAVAGLLGRSRTPRRRALGAALGAAAAAAIADDCANGPRIVRPLLQRRRETTHVIAEAGDPAADRTLVVLAHHDAAPTGAIFDPSFQRWLARTFPDLVEATDTALPIWWPVLAGPLLAAAGAATGRRGLSTAGTVMGLLSAAAFADIARDRHVPGANDNLSGVACLVATARALRERPLEGLRVLLVSAGAEETLQEGIRALAPRLLDPLPKDRSWVLNLDTVGSPRLVMLEGEGPVWMEDYTDPAFRDLVARCAAAAGVSLRRGMRARASTDAVIASRTPLPTATLVSVDAAKALSNYHLMSDVPENVELDTVASAATLVEAVARALAAGEA